MEQSGAPVQPGDLLLGKYRVERVLGQGGMGVVVAARHVDLGELFAIKFLLPKALGVPDAMERFLREARSSARLKGEHVARVHDVGRLDTGMPYMVMEHLSGSDLKEHLRKRGPLPLDEAIALMLQACEAIAEAHAMGIVHRDIKPSNIFLTQRPNGTPCIKVLDFGIAKEISAEGADLTKSGAMLGSPLYMSPEQMKRSKHVDKRTDIWSLGVVFYELITGEVPFHGETLTEIVGRVLQDEPELPSELITGLPAWVDELVMRCLEKQPEERFARVEDLAAALSAKGALLPARVSAPRAAELGDPRSDLASATTAEAQRVSFGDLAGATTEGAEDHARRDLATATTAEETSGPHVRNAAITETSTGPVVGEVVRMSDASSAEPVEPARPREARLHVHRKKSAARDAGENTTLGQSTWGNTSAQDRARRPTGKQRAVAMAALGLAALGVVGAGLARRSPSAPEAPQQAMEAVAPAGEPTSAPTEIPSASTAVTPAPETMTLPATSSSAASPALSAAARKTSTPMATSAKAPSTTSVKAPPKAATTTKATGTPAAQPTATPPPANTTQPKPKYEGVY